MSRFPFPALSKTAAGFDLGPQRTGDCTTVKGLGIRSVREVRGEKMAQQTTRLDRLLLLLDTGTSATTRRTAAEQIGELSEQVRVRAGAGVRCPFGADAWCMAA